MIEHYVKVTLRLIKRSFLFSSINMLGFVFGIAAAFLIYLWVVDELTYDNCFKDADQIYRAVEVKHEAGGEIKESSSTIYPLTRVLREEFPQVEEATAIKYEGIRSMEYNSKTINGYTAYVDSAFFRIFSFPVLEGKPEYLKRSSEYIVLSESMAKKLFGNKHAVGQKIFWNRLSMSDAYTVVAVVKVPVKSHIQFDILFPMSAYYLGLDETFRENINVYVKMKSGDSGKVDMEDMNAMRNALGKLGDQQTLVRFQALEDIHLHTNFSDPRVTNHGNMTTIYLFVALAALVIFMGAFNFTTLSTARASLRYKEIGVRKITGAKRKTLITQFLSESLVQAFISLVLALALTELMLPLFNRFMDTEITLSLSWPVFFYILFGIVGVGCIAGSYPAFYLSSVNPLLAFKGGLKTGKKGGIIKGLVCVQYVIALTLMLLTSIVFKQLNYMQNKDLGLDGENIVCVYTNLWYHVEGLKQDLLKNPNIKSVSMGINLDNFGIGEAYGEELSMRWTDIDGREDSLKMIQMWADNDLIKTYNLKLLKGELMNDDFENYWRRDPVTKKTATPTAIINETAWKAMKVADPLGMELVGGSWARKFRIVGVVKDFNFQSLRTKIKPAFIWYSPESLTYLHIKIAPEHRSETLKYIQQKYEEWAERDNIFIKEFNYQFFSDALNKNYAKEKQQSRMLLFFTIIAIVIAMMGVFGLVSLSTEQRTKEIGIRKVNGAHSQRIVRMFCIEYLLWVGIAFVIACPSGYLLMHRWLSKFAYQTPVSLWLFLLVGAVIAGITLITVLVQTWRKASQNPVDSLRYE